MEACCRCCSVAKSFPVLWTPWTAAHQASLSFTISPSFLRFMSIESVMPSNQLILCCSLLLLSSIFPSIRVFSNESAVRIRWPKYWSFSFSISPSNEYSGLISFRIDWFDLVFQGAFKSLQDHSLRASVETYGSHIDIPPALTLLWTEAMSSDNLPTLGEAGEVSG